MSITLTLQSFGFTDNGSRMHRRRYIYIVNFYDPTFFAYLAEYVQRTTEKIEEWLHDYCSTSPLFALRSPDDRSRFGSRPWQTTPSRSEFELASITVTASHGCLVRVCLASPVVSCCSLVGSFLAGFVVGSREVVLAGGLVGISMLIMVERFVLDHGDKGAMRGAGGGEGWGGGDGSGAGLALRSGGDSRGHSCESTLDGSPEWGEQYYLPLGIVTKIPTSHW
ncbi:hypothetical protein CRG98_040898 [Punica granatum]|uniref:Uncharacterized protein n=1 Tax=Punica granatum TaxID=22663 RepID=A0A2I0I4W5_PUNGR|nr:hypothetical protein CRG98_040898 [Punica granatum]